MDFETDSFKFLIIHGLWNEKIYEFVDFCVRRIYPYFIQVKSIKPSNTMCTFVHLDFNGNDVPIMKLFGHIG